MKVNSMRAIMIGMDECTSIAVSSGLAHMGFAIEGGEKTDDAPDIVLADLSGQQEKVKQFANSPALNKSKLIVFIAPDQRGCLDELLDMEIFDLIEKPVHPRMLEFKIKHALSCLEKERNLAKLQQMLQEAQEEIGIQQSCGAALAKKLVAAESAVSILAEGLQKEREQAERRIALKLRALMLPAIDKLRKAKSLEPYRQQLNIIASFASDLTSDFITDARYTSLLTTSELKVASLIRNGLSTDEIADQLGISPGTVRSHRKRIRKKLGINKAAYSLNNYLLANAQIDNCKRP